MELSENGEMQKRWRSHAPPLLLKLVNTTRRRPLNPCRSCFYRRLTGIGLHRRVSARAKTRLQGNGFPRHSTVAPRGPSAARPVILFGNGRANSSGDPPFPFLNYQGLHTLDPRRVVIEAGTSMKVLAARFQERFARLEADLVDR